MNVPRSFITNLRPGDIVPLGAPTTGARHRLWRRQGVKGVDFSADGGKNWSSARLGEDEGKYSFRQWQADFALAAPGAHVLMVRCTNADGERQPATPVWNPGGYMGNTIESTPVHAA